MQGLQPAVLEAAKTFGLAKLPPFHVGGPGRTSPAGYLGCGYDPLADKLLFPREGLLSVLKSRAVPPQTLFSYVAHRAVGEAAVYRSYDGSGMVPFVPIIDRVLDKLWYRKYWTKVRDSAIAIHDQVVGHAVGKRLAEAGKTAPVPLDGTVMALRRLKDQNPGQFQFLMHRDLVDYIGAYRFATPGTGDREACRTKVEALVRAAAGPKTIFAVERALGLLVVDEPAKIMEAFPKITTALFPEILLTGESHPWNGLPTEDRLPPWWTAKAVQVFRWKSAVPERIPVQPKF